MRLALVAVRVNCAGPHGGRVVFVSDHGEAIPGGARGDFGERGFAVGD